MLPDHVAGRCWPSLMRARCDGHPVTHAGGVDRHHRPHHPRQSRATARTVVHNGATKWGGAATQQALVPLPLSACEQEAAEGGSGGSGRRPLRVEPGHGPRTHAGARTGRRTSGTTKAQDRPPQPGDALLAETGLRRTPAARSVTEVLSAGSVRPAQPGEVANEAPATRSSRR